MARTGRKRVVEASQSDLLGDDGRLGLLHVEVEDEISTKHESITVFEMMDSLA